MSFILQTSIIYAVASQLLITTLGH